MISPAQVPSIGVPRADEARAAARPGPRARCPSVIVVDSPPGMTSASSPSRSRGRAHLARLGAELARATSRVRLEVALDREHADARLLPAAVLQQAAARPRARPISMPGIASPRPREAAAIALGVLEVGGRLDDRARRVRSGSSDLKMPEPTNTPSAPSCIISAASAGVAMPPAEKLHDRQPARSRRPRARARAAPGAPWRRSASSVSSSAVQPPDVAADRAHVAHGLDDVAGAGLALGADHRRALGDPAQRLAEVGGAADERHLERPLVDVVGLVGRASAPRTRRCSRPRAPRAPAPRRSGRCGPSPSPGS